MQILFYNCFSGISGDMNLAAMLDLGVPLDYLLNELKKLPIDNYTVSSESAIKMGISGTKVMVKLPKPEHHHRTFRSIREMIEKSSLDAKVKNTSIEIFHEIAVAEGKIHNKGIDEVHFHEVGAIDSIVDIVGAAICFHYLKPDKVIATAPELGGGFVQCAHGKFPVPAPATMEIVKDIPVTSGKVKSETTTPTGAAILKVLVDEFVEGIDGKIDKIAYGIGHKDFEIPNVLRVGLIRSENVVENETLLLLESNIDDISPEDISIAAENLRNENTLDVWIEHIVMKKGRLAFLLKVLCSPKNKNKVMENIFRETGTLGIRETSVLRYALERKSVNFKSSFGTIDIKESYLGNKLINFKPEADQLAQLADSNNIPVHQLRKEIVSAYLKHTHENE
jgi:uncharacterized protein (TIGR00299 family) protein